MDYEKIEKNALVKKRIQKTFVYILLAVWAVAVLFPFYWMVITSLKEYGAYNSEWTPLLYVLSPTLENYKTAFRKCIFSLGTWENDHSKSSVQAVW